MRDCLAKAVADIEALLDSGKAKNPKEAMRLYAEAISSENPASVLPTLRKIYSERHRDRRRRKPPQQ